jgi:hypothetical protein
MIRDVWGKFDRSTRTAVIVGVVLMVAAWPLPTLVAVLMGMVAAAALGFFHPDNAVKVAIIVVLPVLFIAYFFGFVRGFNSTLLLVILIPSIIVPIWLAKQGARLRDSDA